MTDPVGEADADFQWTPDAVASSSPRRPLFTRRRFLAVIGGTAAAVLTGSGWFVTTRYPAAPDHVGVLAITGGTVLEGEQLCPIERGTVLVRDGHIAAVGPDREVAVPPGATWIDVGGAVVLPGLIDLHVHVGSPELERGEDFGARQLPGLVLDMVRHAPATRRALLEHGVTTVRSLGDDLAWIGELRELIETGELEGPRVFMAGPVITTRGGHPVVTLGVGADSDSVRLPTTAAAARRTVRELATDDAPVDLIKVVQERGRPDRPLEPLEPAVLRAIVEEAHDLGLPVTAHWGTLEDLDDVLAAGVDGLEHVEARGVLEGWPDEVLDQLVDGAVPIAPTLAVTESALDVDVHARLRDRVGELHAAGAWIVAGSDAGAPGVAFGAGLVRELELLVDAGLTPTESLRAATSDAARVLRAPQLGAIAVDRVADLLVVGGDPTVDISQLRRVRAVFRDGRLVVEK